MKKLFKLYFSPSAKWARVLGDTMLIIAGVLGGVTLIEPTMNQALVIVTSICLIIGKILTNFTKKKTNEGIS